MLPLRITSLNVIILLNFCFLNTGILAQVSKNQKPALVPVYKSPEDSIKLAEINHLIHAVYLKGNTPERLLDSLNVVRESLSREGIVRFKRVYYPDERMISVDSLPRVKNPDAVHALTISNKILKDVPPEVLACKNLQTLEFVNCRISRIKRIKKLHHLTELIILNNESNRRLKFPKNQSITSVTIHGEHVASAPVHFRNLKNLKKLDLSESSLKAFPSGIYHNKKLEDVNLQHNNITLEHDRLKPLPSLSRLALQYNKIRSVPSSIQSFDNLQRLNFNHNKIVEIAPEIASLKKLEYLSLYNNELSSIPKGLFGLSSLKLIDLYFNQITEIPDDIAHWKNLEVLFIAHNRIWTLPDTLLSLKNITELYAYDNRLVRLPSRIDKLYKLRVIRVNQNFLKDIPPSLMMLSFIEELDFSDNFITHLSPAMLDFKNLKVVALINNPFDEETLQLLQTKSEEFRGKEIFLHFPGRQADDL
jgi:Leucine-rich repeat (LRR) protein